MTCKYTIKQYQQGFTLIELLIAMSLTGIIGTILFSSYRLVLHHGQEAQIIVGEREKIRILKSIIDNDIANIVMLNRPYAVISKTAQFNIENSLIIPTQEQTPSGYDILLSFSSTHTITYENKEILSDALTPSYIATPAPVCIEYVLRKGQKGNNLFRRERAFCGIEIDFIWHELLLAQEIDDIEISFLFDKEYVSNWTKKQGEILPKAALFSFQYENSTTEDFVIPILPSEVNIHAEKISF